MGKTITTYLIDGDPKGTQYVFISNKICQMFVIPRANLSILNERTDLQTPAFYILLGEDENIKPKAYIGETENFRERVKSHDSKKVFWQKALIFISKDAAMTKADVQYLEHRAIADAKKANVFVLDENKQIPKSPNLPEYQKDSMDEFYDAIKFLTSFIGCNIFEIIEPKDKPIFRIISKKCDAKGFYDTSGFTVLKGSKVSDKSTDSLSWRDKRAKMIEEYTDKKNGVLILKEDVTFSSPSKAADFCLGSSSNGWISWKTENGQTLDSVYRKQLE